MVLREHLRPCRSPDSKLSSENMRPSREGWKSRRANKYNVIIIAVAGATRLRCRRGRWQPACPHHSSLDRAAEQPVTFLRHGGYTPPRAARDRSGYIWGRQFDPARHFTGRGNGLWQQFCLAPGCFVLLGLLVAVAWSTPWTAPLPLISPITPCPTPILCAQLDFVAFVASHTSLRRLVPSWRH